MARTTKRRRRKRRGTQSGSIDRARSSGPRPRSRQEARARARRQMGQRRQGKRDRRDLQPTWRSAMLRGLFGAGIFLVLLVALFGRPFLPSLALAVVMLALYVPMGYAIERLFYNRRLARARQERERRARGE